MSCHAIQYLLHFSGKEKCESHVILYSAILLSIFPLQPMFQLVTLGYNRLGWVPTLGCDGLGWVGMGYNGLIVMRPPWVGMGYDGLRWVTMGYDGVTLLGEMWVGSGFNRLAQVKKFTLQFA